jgi:hypothetical protein
MDVEKPGAEEAAYVDRCAGLRRPPTRAMWPRVMATSARRRGPPNIHDRPPRRMMSQVLD